MITPAMSSAGSTASIGEGRRTSPVELLWDLVFVFAITQVTGYLILENGIFVFAQLLHDAMPFVVEVGVMLDLVVGIFVMGIVINHIQREFSSVDTEQLAELRD